MKHNEKVLKKELGSGIHSLKNYLFTYKLHKQIKRYVRSELTKMNYSGNLKFVFSDFFYIINGLKFGRTFGKSGDIYAGLDLSNNLFKRISFNPSDVENVEDKLGFKVQVPYVLCQLGFREIVKRSTVQLNEHKIINDIAKKIQVVILNFSTGRNFDSGSFYTKEGENIHIYNCDNFHEQATLIGNAKRCVFFTVGDFRSHNYIPPFMGKNVYAVASKSVYNLPTTPIDFWNQKVFTFGGQIIPVVYEELSDTEKYSSFIQEVSV